MAFNIASYLSFILLIIALVLLYQLQTLNKPFIPSLFSTNSNSLDDTVSKLRDSVTYLPLKDLRFANSPSKDHTWFMSSINDTIKPNQPQHLYFPSKSSKHRILCLKPQHHNDGTKNYYAFAYPNALPYNATLLNGLTVVSDTLYDYTNIWHGLSAIVPFLAWYESSSCIKPERWVLFHWGELRVEMSNWVQTLAKASVNTDIRIEKFENYEGAVCFEKSVVFRHLEGGIVKERREQVYDMIRCKARKYCGVKVDDDKSKVIRILLWFRVGRRAFKNETLVTQVFEKECKKVEGCAVKVARPNNLTFCHQVKLLGETDIVVSAHGAQLTNIIFMDKGSSVMEFYPKGWLEHAGVGQYVYKWMSDWAGMKHQGVWRDQEGQDCPYKENGDCFHLYKDANIGHDEAYFASWMAKVLKEVKEMKMKEVEVNKAQKIKQSACPCD